jgi:hypothetical protein
MSETCPECDHETSREATLCPNCGRGVAKCPHCGARNVGRFHGLYGAREVIVTIVLLLLYVVPGIIYYIYIETVPFCPDCRKRVWRRAPKAVTMG